MTSINIEMYDALIAAKVPKKKARAAAAGVLPHDQAATKADLKALETRLTWRMFVIGGGFATLIVAILVLIN